MSGKIDEGAIVDNPDTCSADHRHLHAVVKDLPRKRPDGISRRLSAGVARGMEAHGEIGVREIEDRAVLSSEDGVDPRTTAVEPYGINIPRK